MDQLEYYQMMQKESMLIIAKAPITFTNEIMFMVRQAKRPMELALSLKLLQENNKLTDIEDLLLYQKWLEIDGHLFLGLVNIDKHNILNKLSVNLSEDHQRDYAFFSTVAEILKRNLDDILFENQEIINHPQFDIINLAVMVKSL